MADTVVPNRVYETMTRVECCGFRVRVWRTAVDVGAVAPDEEIRAALAEEVWHDRDDIAAKVETFAGVAAYEIVDGAGNGIVVYPDWS